MEVVGGLINATFLVAICLTLLLDAMQRFFEPPQEELNKSGLTLIIVAGVGLAVNLGGVAIFGHSHGGGHGHSHGGPSDGHGHDHGAVKETSHGAHGAGHTDLDGEHGGHGVVSESELVATPSIGSSDVTVIHVTSTSSQTSIQLRNPYQESHGALELKSVEMSKIEKEKLKKKHNSTGNLNIRAILLHTMGDALGSLAVIISGLFIYFLKDERRHLADPVCTLFITVVILGSALPLIKQTMAILLQKVPEHINLREIQEQIVKVSGIYQIHDVHVWQLSQDKIVASLHALISKNCDFMKIADQVKNIFHSHGIHASTIQPEYIGDSFGGSKETRMGGDLCHEVVCDEDECHKKSCCPPSSKEGQSQ